MDKRSGGNGHGHMDPPAEQDGDEADSEFVELDPSGRYGRYKEVLGKGAFKTVYRAFDELEGMEVAWNQVKAQDVLQSSEDLERLYSEVHLLKTLKHKNIIKFYNSWVDTKNDNINFITEIFTSGTLRQYRKRHKHVNMRAVKNWSRQILRGLLYLHSHDPPIIHRDLKCDNIFINGNQGEVKIGDLGLAAILRQAHAAHSVIGTPEFMAPELYEEEYNELVDIYAFGMCLLEMITSEYPYSECANAAQIYKKVTSGVKPAALDKVKDPEVRQFVEKCLASASRRLPARELLMDPFLQYEEEREGMDPASHRSHLHAFGNNFKELATFVEEPGPGGSYSDMSCVSKLGFSDMGNFRQVEDPQLPIRSNAMTGACIGTESASVDNYHHLESDLKDQASPSSSKQDSSRMGRDFTVKGQKKDDNTIFLRLRIADSKGHVRNIHFPFDIDADTAMSVASEMVAELDLSDQDVTNIAAMIDAEIQALVPEWKPGAAFEDTAGDEEICNNYRSSKIEDDYSEIPSDGDIPSGTFVLERLPSGRKYWSDSPRSLTVDSLITTTLSASSRTEGLMHGRFEEGSCDQSVASNSQKQCNETNIFSESVCHGDNGHALDTRTQSSKCLGSIHSDGNVLMFNQDKEHSQTEVVKSTVVAEVKMPTYYKQANCKIQERYEGMGQENFQKEACRIDNDLSQHVCAVAYNDKIMSAFDSSAFLPEGTDIPIHFKLEDERIITQKLQNLILKQQEELEGLKQKHKEALRGLIYRFLKEGSTVSSSKSVLVLNCNDVDYKVPVTEGPCSKRASKNELFDQACYVNCREESDKIFGHNVSLGEFNNMTSVLKKETGHEATCKDIDIKTAKKRLTSGLATGYEHKATCTVSPLNKTTIITKEEEQFYSAKSTRSLELSSFTDCMLKRGTVCQQINISTAENSFKQDVAGVQFKLADNTVKESVSNCMNASHAIDNPRKPGSFIEFYKGGSPLRDRPNSCRGDGKFYDMDSSGDVSSNSSKPKSNQQLFDQLKKEQLQKSIAELEAKTLEGLQQSKSGYLISSLKIKPSAGVSHPSPVGFNACITRQPFASEISKG